MDRTFLEASVRNASLQEGLSVRPSVGPLFRPSVGPSVRRSVRPSIGPSVRRSVGPSVRLSVTQMQKRVSQFFLATVRSYTETNDQPTCFDSLLYHLVVSPVCSSICLSIYVT